MANEVDYAVFLSVKHTLQPKSTPGNYKTITRQQYRIVVLALPRKRYQLFFNRFFPLELKRLMIDCTNSNFRINQRHVDIAEIDQFMGVLLAMGALLAMCVNPAVCIDEYWSLEDNGFKPAKWFKEKTGMSKNRWEEIRSALGFWEGNGDLMLEEDEWSCAEVVRAMGNENMDNSFIASGFVMSVCATGGLMISMSLSNKDASET